VRDQPTPRETQLRLLWIAGLLLIGQLGAMVVLNEWIMTEQVRRGILGDQLPEEMLEQAVRFAQTAELVGYLALPLSTALRIGVNGLILAVSLRICGRPVRGRTLVEPLLWGQWLLLAGTWMQVGWLATLSPAERIGGALHRMPGSLGLFLPRHILGLVPDPLVTLVESITLFELGQYLLLALLLPTKRGPSQTEAALGTTGLFAVHLIARLLLLSGH